MPRKKKDEPRLPAPTPPPGKLVWLTDVHLNFVDAPGREALYGRVRALEPSAILLGGDIAEASSLEFYLDEMSDCLPMPIYFVLGNRDYYGGKVPAVRETAERLCDRKSNLRWLSREGVVNLPGGVCLVGHDSWADGRLGEFLASPLSHDDLRQVGDFQGLSREAQLATMRELAGQAEDHFRRLLPEALTRTRSVLLLTHPPPFAESCSEEGDAPSELAVPYFVSKGAGDFLRETMRAHPENDLTVFCGHTHTARRTRILPNLLALVGGARYGEPEVQLALDLGG